MISPRGYSGVDRAAPAPPPRGDAGVLQILSRLPARWWADDLPVELDHDLAQRVRSADRELATALLIAAVDRLVRLDDAHARSSG